MQTQFPQGDLGTFYVTLLFNLALAVVIGLPLGGAAP